jgi:hypothetical protein
MTGHTSGVLGSDRSKSERPILPRFPSGRQRYASPAASDMSQLTGRTPARSNASHTSILYPEIMPCAVSKQWFAGAGSYSSIGRVAQGGLGG